jgi:hypothetical protein
MRHCRLWELATFLFLSGGQSKPAPACSPAADEPRAHVARGPNAQCPCWPEVRQGSRSTSGQGEVPPDRQPM